MKQLRDKIRMLFDLKKQLDYSLYLIDEQKDSYKVWWVTLTSIFSAISIGGILAYFSGKIEESSIDSFLDILSILFLVLITFVFEIFFLSIELQEKRSKLIQIYLKADQEKSSRDLDSAIDLIFLRKVPKRFTQWRTIITLLSIFYFGLATIVFIPLIYALIDLIFPRNTNPLPITAYLGAFTIVLIILLYFTHREVIKYISAWPEDPPWIEKKNKGENTHDKTEKN